MQESPWWRVATYHGLEFLANSPPLHQCMIFEISGYTFSYNITVVINRGNNGRKAGEGEKSNGIVRMKNLSRNQCVFRSL